jgi:hypothetical protein
MIAMVLKMVTALVLEIKGLWKRKYYLKLESNMQSIV